MTDTQDNEIGLDAADVDRAMTVSDHLKHGLKKAVLAALRDADRRGIPKRVQYVAVTTEALLLAAFMHCGTDDSFRSMGEGALSAAREAKRRSQQ